MSSLAPPAPDLAVFAATASALAATPVRSLVAVTGGANNRLFRVEDANGTAYALKAYLRDRSDTGDRIGRECQGLSFLWRRGLRAVPRFVALDAAAACALFSWVDGEPVGRAGARDIDAALGFIRDLKSAAAHGEATALQPAAEACLSGAALVGQIEDRLARLRQAARGNPALARFLETGVAPRLASYGAAAETGFGAAGLSFDEPLPRAFQTLSPSDFGFHNALRTGGRSLVFLDFEYFGWDDPVKLVADFLLHPGMRLGLAQRTRFRRGAEAIFAADPAFSLRLRLFYPLFGLRWAAIILNEFLPERWHRRAFAGVEDQAAAAARQLAKAKRLLAGLTASKGGIPNDG